MTNPLIAPEVINSMTKTDRLVVDRLTRLNKIDASAMSITLAEWRQHGSSVHSHLVRLGFVGEIEMRDLRAGLLALPVIDLHTQKPDPVALKLLPPALAKRHQLLPISLLSRNELLLAAYETENLVALDQVRAHLLGSQITQVRLALATAKDLAREMERAYSNTVTVESLLTQARGTLSIDALVQAILQNAFELESSDIHLEPDEHFLRIRFRIDGVLRQVHLLHSSLWDKLAVKFKLMAGMNIAESRAAQDGRFALELGNTTVDFRVACLPTAHGENIVLRLLDRSKNIVPLKQLKLPPETMNGIAALLAKPEGIVLVTGPTGSGKTTTLYSLLAQVSSVGVNVMTLEDPIEYPLPLIRQTQVSDKVSFADGIRALMRQDPDVILLGEIRDQETAEMALRAAMTGHQVFATLHTNSALAAVQRLRDMGIPPDLIAGNVIGVIGQRLARRLCPHCKTPDTLSPENLALLQEADAGNTATVYRAVGCEHCYGLGYRGRVLLMEVAVFDEQMDELVGSNGTLPDLLRHARSKGFKTLRDAALRRVLAGETTLDEVARTVSLALR